MRRWLTYFSFHSLDEGDKAVRKKRKSEGGEVEVEGNEDVTVYEQSPKKRRRTGLRRWLSKVF